MKKLFTVLTILGLFALALGVSTTTANETRTASDEIVYSGDTVVTKTCCGDKTKAHTCKGHATKHNCKGHKHTSHNCSGHKDPTHTCASKKATAGCCSGAKKVEEGKK